MKHAGPATLDRLAPLLDELRALPDLREKSRGTFYRRGRACLHFHEDPAGMYADLRLTGDLFTRLPVETPEEQAALLSQIRTALNEAP